METKGDGKAEQISGFDHFEQVAPGPLSASEFDGFVRDTVNFLDYAGEPAQPRPARVMGMWVVLFLMVFTDSPGCSRRNIGRTYIEVAGLAP